MGRLIYACHTAKGCGYCSVGRSVRVWPCLVVTMARREVNRRAFEAGVSRMTVESHIWVCHFKRALVTEVDHREVRYLETRLAGKYRAHLIDGIPNRIRS